MATRLDGQHGEKSCGWPAETPAVSAAGAGTGSLPLSGEAFRMAKYVCHRTDWLTEGGGTAVLVRSSIDHYTLPVQGLKHLEAAAMQVMMASKPVKILPVYLLVSICFGPVCLPWRQSSRPHGE